MMRVFLSLLKNRFLAATGLVSGMAGLMASDAMAQDVIQELVERIDEVDHVSGGLPQFDPSSFTSQVFWLVIMFTALYTILSRISLPKIASVINARETKIGEDRDEAEAKTNQAGLVMEEYETSLIDARTQSAQISADTTQAIKNNAEQALAAFQKKADLRMEELDTALNNSKTDAMEDMTNIAAEIASAAAEKIVGLSTDLNQAKDVVQSLNKVSKAA